MRLEKDKRLRKTCSLPPSEVIMGFHIIISRLIFVDDISHLFFSVPNKQNILNH